MAIDQVDQIDFYSIDRISGDLWLTISDHMPWDIDDGNHLVILQDKLNTYLSFIESGEVHSKVPSSNGRRIVIILVGKFPMSSRAESFFQMAAISVARAGFSLRFQLTQPN
ncbi:DUF6572 domain-containing protein [Neorhizobium sp. NCHU2750]|uniref:DUF6572 domain-containing protein n=1 Tax=Neorhizobium sp. NCHU2750 TaxID=1825976 RepID=UPI000E728861